MSASTRKASQAEIPAPANQHPSLIQRGLHEGKEKILAILGLSLLLGIFYASEHGLAEKIIDSIGQTFAQSQRQLPAVMQGIWRNSEPADLRDVLFLQSSPANGQLILNDEAFDVEFIEPLDENWRIQLRCHNTQCIVTEPGMLNRLANNELQIVADRKNGEHIDVTLRRPAR